MLIDSRIVHQVFKTTGKNTKEHIAEIYTLTQYIESYLRVNDSLLPGIREALLDINKHAEVLQEKLTDNEKVFE